MLKFYILLWLRWLFRVTMTSLIIAIILSFMITIGLYINHGLEPLTQEIIKALQDIFWFWFPISWSLSLLLSLFLSLKYIFNSCYGGYELKLLECATKEIIDPVGYGDLVRVWRKWFMVIIWIVAVEMVIALFISTLFTNYNSIFEWFNIYILFVFILLAGFMSFILLAGRCKRVKVIRC